MSGPRNRVLRALIAIVVLLFGRRGERGDERGDDRGRRAEPPLARELEVGSTRRVENGVLAMLALGTAAAVAFVVLYVVDPNTQLLGLTLGVAFAAMAAAVVMAAKALVVRETAIDEYKQFGDEEATEDVAAIAGEPAGGVSRRRLLAGAAGTAGLALGAAAIVPAASFGPNVGDRIRTTPWRRGVRLVDVHRAPIRAGDIQEGNFLTALAEGAERSDLSASLIVVRLAPDQLDLSPKQRAGAPNGIIAFSKICTHAACAVSMFRDPLYPPTSPTPALVCPCHYSTFDPRRGGEVVFGPAARPLPQLPLQVNGGGELEAAGDYFGQIGPSYGGIRHDE
jgi:ubiquinol-cytochrome c reductase iron-sulfur subunit